MIGEEGLIAIGKLLETAYRQMADATRAHFEAAEAEIAAEFEFKERRAYWLTAGKLPGNNAEQREASLLVVMQEDRATWAEAEEAARKTRLELELAKLKLERAKNHLRLAELAGSQPMVMPNFSIANGRDEFEQFDPGADKR